MSLPFLVQFLPVENLSALAEDKNVLAAIRFASIASAENTQKPLFSVGLPNLALSNVVEVWYSDTPIQTTRVDGLQLSWNDDILFGHLLLDETQYQNLTSMTKYAYQLIFNTLQSFAYSNILRIWNYLPSSNPTAQGLPSYHAFCEGRHQSLKTTNPWHYVPPASTTIGTACSGLQIYFIAAKKSGKQLQNPRQASDVLYPRVYGPVRPTFSHAVIKKWQDTTHLYISGTLSIVDYEKRHNGKVLLQLDEVLDNIERLIIHGAEQHGFFLKSLTDLSHLKIYLCDLFMLSITEELLIRRYGHKLPSVLFLRGDICETDLLIEVEAIYTQGEP